MKMSLESVRNSKEARWGLRGVSSRGDREQGQRLQGPISTSEPPWWTAVIRERGFAEQVSAGGMPLWEPRRAPWGGQ